jgi:hypothetical protein
LPRGARDKEERHPRCVPLSRASCLSALNSAELEMASPLSGNIAKCQSDGDTPVGKALALDCRKWRRPKLRPAKLRLKGALAFCYLGGQSEHSPVDLLLVAVRPSDGKKPRADSYHCGQRRIVAATGNCIPPSTPQIQGKKVESFPAKSLPADNCGLEFPHNFERSICTITRTKAMQSYVPLSPFPSPA